MRVRVQPAGLGELVSCDDARSIVIYDDFDNPILVAQKFKRGQILTYTPGSAGFEKALTALGIGLNSTYKVVR
jgi:hypothetical protein